MTSIVGVPRETKSDEHRIAITPDGVRELTGRGATVLVEVGAGLDSAIPDAELAGAGARLVPDAAEVWGTADLIVKVKEPQPDEFALLRADAVLFTYLHLAAYPEVADALLASGTTAIAYETVQDADGSLPLLAPMSEVAGRMAVQVGATHLERHHGGRGVLLGGAPGVQPGRVVVLGAGNVGWNAAWIAAGMEAEVNLLDRDLDRLRFVDQIHKGRITTLASNTGAIERVVVEADLVIGAVLVAGGRAPVLLPEDLVAAMRPGAVVVDVAIDQGGTVEGIRETSHHDPVYERHGVMHYAVPNIPGAVPRTSTYALTNATLPYVAHLATRGVAGAVRVVPELAPGVNTVAGSLTNEVVATALGHTSTPLAEALEPTARSARSDT
jgi:alanine dehydrogenase